MTEWGVVSVIVVLAGLLISIATPIIKLNSTLTKLTTQMENFMRGLDEFKTRYTNQLQEFHETHEDIYNKVNNHECRIIRLETKQEK